ncbi:MAG: J domain-containing protein [Bacteroidetes bacterium]|nr:J domain-containing protein [Bacteroidota bacterium]
MKDYYYFLGVKHNATDDDIRKAYRKLSLKYHPDKNDNDPFFEARFREIQEAYDLLSNPENRRIYDDNFGHHQRLFRNEQPPYIRSFSSSKIRARKGDIIHLNWQTHNADLVKILPFGLEKAYGERSFKITDFKDGQFHVVLQATNTLINKSVVKGITIVELLHGEEANEDESQVFQGTDQPTFTNFTKRNNRKVLFWGLVIIMLFTFLKTCISG